MTFRALTHEEWPDIEHEFQSRGVGLPDPTNSFIEGAFYNDGTIAGFQVCQPQIHVEPLRLYDSRAYRGLMRAMEAELERRYGRIPYFVLAEKRVGLMAEALGFKKRPESIYQKAVA